MQTPKTRSSSSGTAQKISPRSSEVSQKNSATPPKAEASQKVSSRVVRQPKMSPRYSGHTASSANLLSKAPKEKSAKVVDHRSPRSPITEKKRLGRVSELENQVSQLEKDLKILKDQLCSTEEQKKLARRDAEESNQQLQALSLKLDESQKQVSDSAALASALDQSRAHVNFLEELVSEMKADSTSKDSHSEVESVKFEVDQLRSALEATELRYNDKHARSEEEIRNAFEMVERMKSESGQGEAELGKFKHEVEELKANLMDKETELQGICEENEGLSMKLEATLSGQGEIELEKAKLEIENLRAGLMEKETKWQTVSDENEKLKSEIKEMSKVFEARDMIESAKDVEREEVNKGDEDKLDVAQAEMEAELRRMKVQSEQWRKAAEAAAAIIAAGKNNGQQAMERSGSMDSHYRGPRTGRVRSLYKDDLLDEDLMKKKNGNVLGRFGVLWKKQQK